MIPPTEAGMRHLFAFPCINKKDGLYVFLASNSTSVTYNYMDMQCIVDLRDCHVYESVLFIVLSIVMYIV